MSIMLFKTSILAAFVNEIKFFFLLLVKYHVREFVKNSFISKILLSGCNVRNMEWA